jgi:hypothetical protein
MAKSDTALIIGNGPSVDQLDPALFDHFTTFGCNHIGKQFKTWARETDNVVITDSNRLEEIKDTYKDYKGGLFVGNQRYVVTPYRKTRSLLGRDFTPLRQLKKQTLEKFLLIDTLPIPKLAYTTVFAKDRFTFDFSKGINFGYSVVISAIQIAVIQGFKTILLTGVDSNYRKPIDYFGSALGEINFVNFDFIAAPRRFMEPLLVLLQIYFEATGVRLYDCTPGGKLRFISKASFSLRAPYFLPASPQFTTTVATTAAP